MTHMRGLEWIPKDIKKACIKYTHVYKNCNYAMKSYLYVWYEYKGQYYDHNKCQREISRELRSHYLEKINGFHNHLIMMIISTLYCFYIISPTVSIRLPR